MAGDFLGFERILVTGGHGFVGRMLVPALRKAGSATTRLLLGVTDPMAGGPEPEVAMDLLDDHGVGKVVADFQPDLVIHLAAQSWPAGSAKSAAETWSVNLCGSLALARAIAAHAPTANVLFVSSAEVYGSSFRDGPADEKTPLRPLSVYARSKAAAEFMLADVLPGSARLIVVRPSNHSGPGQDERFVVPAFAAQIARIECGREPPRIKVGNLTARRDFLDVRDVVEAYVAVLRAAHTLPARSVFNIGSGEAVAVEHILSSLRSMSGLAVEVEIDPDRMRASEIPIAALDVAAIARAVGWRARHDLADMLGAVLADQRRLLNVIPTE